MNEYAPQSFHYEPPQPVGAGGVVPILCASPHSGRHYPQAWLEQSDLSHMALRKSEDVAIDRLYEGMPKLGMGLLVAQFARAYVDLNRDRTELDPALIDGAPSGRGNARVASGLGVIPRIVGPRTYIQKGKITLAEAEARLSTVWDPYHTILNSLLTAQRARAGCAILLDLHSMPQAALDAIGQPQIEIVLGDLHGRSCAPWLSDILEAAFITQGFRVQRNIPFAGAYNMQRYGNPRQNLHAFQIEISRRLYVDEGTYTLSPEFPQVQDRIYRAMAQASEMILAELDVR